MIERKSKDFIIKSILTSLKSGPKNINEIASIINSGWETTKKTLELLQELGIINGEKKGNEMVYNFSKENKITNLNKNTLFGLPLSKEHENISKMIFSKIKKEWFNNKKSYPNKTEMQKTAIEVIDKLNIKIPSCWYLFGKVLLMQCNIEEEYTYEEFEIKDLDKTINEAVKDYSSCNSASKAMDKQYKDKNNLLYQIKKKINNYLVYCTFNETEKTSLMKDSYILLQKLNKNDFDLESYNLIESFVSIFNQLLLNIKSNELEEIRDLLLDSFTKTWEIIAIFNLVSGLINENYYTKEELNPYIENIIFSYKTLLESYLNELNCYIPKKEEIDKELLKFKGIIKNTKNLDKKEIFKEFEEKPSDILREFDLN